MMDNDRRLITWNANCNPERYDQTRTKAYNNNRSRAVDYQVGDLVLNNITRRVIGNKMKFTPS